MTDDDQEHFNNSGKDRHYYLRQVDSIQSNESLLDYLRLLKSLDLEQLEFAVYSFCDLASKCPLDLQSSFESILYDLITNVNSSRALRKSSCECLKTFYADKLEWKELFVLLDAMDEPQFHLIKPILPRFGVLMQTVESGIMPWKWARAILIRSFMHSNGWVRLWGLESSVAISCKILAEDQQFISSVVFSELNGNDLFWRLIERNHLHSFMTQLGELLQQIMSSYSDDVKVKAFLIDILFALERTTCPVTFFYISKVVQMMKLYPLFGGEEIIPLMRRVLSKARYIAFSSLRVTTMFHLVSFMASGLKWNSTTVFALGSLTTFFSTDCPSLLNQFSSVLENVWKENMLPITLPCPSVCSSSFLCSDNTEVLLSTPSDSYKLLWKWCNFLKCSRSLFDDLWLQLLEMIEDGGTDPRTAAVFSALLHAPEGHEYCQWNSDISAEVRETVAGHILLNVAQSEGKPFDASLIREVYLPFLRRFHPKAVIRIPDTIFPRCAREYSLSLQRYGILCMVLKDVALNFGGNVSDLKVFVEKYICSGNNLIEVPSLSRTLPITAKEYARMLSNLRIDRLHVFKRIESEIRSDAKDVVDCVIAQLDSASTFQEKDLFLQIIFSRISQIPKSQRIEVVKAIESIVKEERKSQNFLPCVRYLFSFLLHPTMIADVAVKELAQQLFAKFLDSASLSVPVALVLAEALSNSNLYLDSSWVPQVVRLAIFGPVPKKDQKVLSHAYSSIYASSLVDFLPNNTVDRVHEVLQRTRILAINVAVLMARRSKMTAAVLIREIISHSKMLDNSSSKSFGLSLAHRQKTRAVSLLLLICEEADLNNKDTESALFEHCVDCIVDPCQQFSIKLIVEWILVRLCMRKSSVIIKILELQKKFAAVRIGSISSWINVIVHYSKLESENEILIEELVTAIVPWATAQNFAVRCTAIAALKVMYPSFSPGMKKKYALVGRINEFDSEGTGNSKRIIDNLTMDFYFAKLNMLKHFDMQTIFTIIPLKTGLPFEETLPLNIIENANTTSIPSKCADDQFLEAPSLVYNSLSKNASSAPEMIVRLDDENGLNDTIAPAVTFQRKIVTKEHVKDSSCSMVVVASLIDKPNNLGGLCRTSEIFGVDTLIISDMLLTVHTGFKALSMSSENWQKIEAVKPDQLLQYLQRQRKNGYTVIAAEQTTDSVPLHSFIFPKKCVLLMGDEKEGVPTKLLRAVDQTVEIKQLGQTRSLNVHVTAALFIAQYAQQLLL